MERYTMFLVWKNQHCENGYTFQSNLQIQCNLYQTTNFSQKQKKKFHSLYGNRKDREQLKQSRDRKMELEE